MSDEPLYTCRHCMLTWKESQLYAFPAWDPAEICPICYGPVWRKDYGDLPLFGDLFDTPPGR